MDIINPYAHAFTLPWFKGDLHIHSDISDGHASREQIRDRLRACGFHFAALADHDRYHPTDDDDHPIFLGNSEMRGTEGGDVLTLFAEVEPAPQTSVQDLIDQTRQAGGLAILAHPRIGEFGTTKHHWSYTSAQLIGTYRDFQGMEIYTHNVGSGFQTAVDRLDALWIARCAASSQPVQVWGYATSDAHDLHRIVPNAGILTAAVSCSETDLRLALETGRFYSLADSTARFTSITAADGVISITAAGARMLRLYGRQQSGASGDRRLLAIAWATPDERLTVDYAVTGTEGFVRAEAMDHRGGCIYANPLQVVP